MFWKIGFLSLWDMNRAIKLLSQKKKDNAIITIECANAYSFESLGEKQIMVYNIILEHYRGGGDRQPLCMIIQGTGGTRKSYLIGSIKHSMEFDYRPNKIPLLLLAPTVVSTFNISATIIHSALHIPVQEMTGVQGSCLITL